LGKFDAVVSELVNAAKKDNELKKPYRKAARKAIGNMKSPGKV